MAALPVIAVTRRPARVRLAATTPPIAPQPSTATCIAATSSSPTLARRRADVKVSRRCRTIGWSPAGARAIAASPTTPTPRGEALERALPEIAGGRLLLD